MDRFFESIFQHEKMALVVWTYRQSRRLRYSCHGVGTVPYYILVTWYTCLFSSRCFSLKKYYRGIRPVGIPVAYDISATVSAQSRNFFFCIARGIRPFLRSFVPSDSPVRLSTGVHCPTPFRSCPEISGCLYIYLFDLLHVCVAFLFRGCRPRTTSVRSWARWHL